MDFLNPAVFDKVGTVALCVFAVVALMRGWVVPGSWVRSRLAEKDEQITRLNESVDRTLEVGRTLETVLSTVRDLAEQRRREP